MKSVKSENKFIYQIEFILKFVTSGNLLEIGPSFGTFSLQAKYAGFKVDAIEMDTRCCEFLSKSVGINAVNSNCPEQAITIVISSIRFIIHCPMT